MILDTITECIKLVYTTGLCLLLERELHTFTHAQRNKYDQFEVKKECRNKENDYIMLSMATNKMRDTIAIYDTLTL